MMTRCDEVRHKHRQAAAYLDGHNLDAIVLAQRANFAWYTAGGMNHVGTADSIGAAGLLITREQAVCITNNIEAARLAEEELANLGIEVLAAPWHDDAALASIWSARIGRLRAACDVPLPALPGQVTRLETDFASLRWVMTGGEIERYRTLARESAECLESASRQARPGMSEWELASRIAAAALDRGIRTPVLLVAADERVRRYRHPIPTGRKLERYGMGVLGAERHGLIVSQTRLFRFGPMDDDLKRRHSAVCQVDASMIAATRLGQSMASVLEIAQQVYADQGFADEWSWHHQGGLTGYLGREIRVTPGTQALVEAGQIFAWNPSIAGTKSEDTILVCEDANQVLSVTGRWPVTAYPAGDQTWLRCDICEV